MYVNLTGLYSVEYFSPTSAAVSRLRKIIAYKKTKYQDVLIAEFEEYGLCFVLDGYTQSTEMDEYIYHESLVQPVMFTHPEPRDVLIIGGGEGATLREVLKHRTVRRAVMVDIDGEAVELAKKYLEKFHQGSFYDPRAELVIMDGKKYVEEAEGDSFDVVIIDLTDPYSSEIAFQLYTEPFYREVYRVLRPEGVMVTQAGSPFFYQEAYDRALENVKKVFPAVKDYNVWIPSFCYACGFIIGSKTLDPESLTAEKVDQKIEERGLKGKLRFYSGRTHIAIMNMPVCRKK